jgi:hypothetical protein
LAGDVDDEQTEPDRRERGPVGDAHRVELRDADCHLRTGHSFAGRRGLGLMVDA